jgi:uncharacterized tellurite resistance protein B-like protein
MIYVSDGYPAIDEASTINLGLPIGNAERGVSQPLPYYSQYAWITPDQRAAYLQWLAAGRKDENPASRELGYIFLFFYGLERRLLVDKGQEQEVVAEVVRLLHHYGFCTRSRSLQRYASQLVHFWGWKQGTEYYAQLLDWMKTLPVSLLGQDELAIILASQFQSNRPLSTAMAYEVASRDFVSRRSVVVSRVNDEFRELFGKRYLEKFPDGMQLNSSKRSAHLSYRPASPTLLYSSRNYLTIEIPDVLGMSSQFKPLSAIWNDCVEALADYSRARFKTGTPTKDLKKYLALPKELRMTAPHPLAKEWEAILAKGRPGKDCTFIDIDSIARIIAIPERERLTPGQSRELAETIESLGFIVEPDPRHEYAYTWEQEVVVFKSLGAEIASPSQNYLGASALLKLCVLVAGADGHIAPEELEVFRKFLGTKISLSEDDQRRLEFLEQVLITNSNKINSFLTRITKSVTKEQRELICEVLVHVAAADHIITKDEIRALEHVFKAFELPPEKLEIQLKSITSDGGEVTIQTAGTRVSGERIPSPGQPFHLDMVRVDRIAQETSEVVGILSKVMAEEGVDDESPRQNVKIPTAQPSVCMPAIALANTDSQTPTWLMTLDPKYRPVLIQLLVRDSWSRAEFDDVAKKLRLMPLDAFDAINGWADENLGDFLLEGEDTILIHKELIHGRN